MTEPVSLLVGFVAGLAPSVFLLLLLRRNGAAPKALAQLQRELAESSTRANADMTGRVERIKGEASRHVAG